MNERFSLRLIVALLFAVPAVAQSPVATLDPINGHAKVVPQPGDNVIPQIANGELAGGHTFSMWYSIVNITGSPASFTLTFYDDAGNPLAVPMAQTDGSTAPTTGLGGAIPGEGFRIGYSAPEGAPVTSGYAVFMSEPEGAIVVTGIFNNQVPGERAFQASVPVTTFFHRRFYIN